MLERAQQSVDALSNDAAIIVVAVHSLMIWPNIYLYRSLQRLRVRTRERSFNSPDNYKHTYILTPGVRPISVFTIVSSTDTNKNSLASASNPMPKTNPKTKSKANPDKAPKRSRHLVICSSVGPPMPSEEQRQTK